MDAKRISRELEVAIGLAERSPREIEDQEMIGRMVAQGWSVEDASRIVYAKGPAPATKKQIAAADRLSTFREFRLMK